MRLAALTGVGCRRKRGLACGAGEMGDEMRAPLRMPPCSGHAARDWRPVDTTPCLGCRTGGCERDLCDGGVGTLP